MKSREIIKLFREGLCIAALAEKEWAEQKEARKERQAAYLKQKSYVSERRKLNKGFRLHEKDRVVVGRPCTKFKALAVVEKAIYEDIMKQSKVG